MRRWHHALWSQLAPRRRRLRQRRAARLLAGSRRRLQDLRWPCLPLHRRCKAVSWLLQAGRLHAVLLWVALLLREAWLWLLLLRRRLRLLG